MSPSHLPLIISSVAAIAAFTFAGEARASHLDACGGIWLDAEAAGRCEVVTKESCETRCEPASTERICATRLYNECAPSCQLTADVECTASCTETCGTECLASGSIDCGARCVSECIHEVQDVCGGGVGQCSEQGGSCCAHSCDAHCEAEASVECSTVCETSCTGECEARAQMDCQMECQSVEFEACGTAVVQECNEECETSGAAIFCDGHFLATGGDLDACAAQLEAEFSISLDVDIDVDVDLTDGHEDCDELEEDIEDAVSCSVAGPGGGALGLLVLVALGTRVRRREQAA
jgi:MYXO-CTERM domain-containing protein